MGKSLSKLYQNCLIGSEYTNMAKSPDSTDGTSSKGSPSSSDNAPFNSFLKIMNDDSLQMLAKSSKILIIGGEDSSGFKLRSIFRSSFSPSAISNYLLLEEERTKWESTIESIEKLGNLMYTVSYTKTNLISVSKFAYIVERVPLEDGLVHIENSIDPVGKIHLETQGYWLSTSSEGSEVVFGMKMNVEGALLKSLAKKSIALSLLKNHEQLEESLKAFYKSIHNKGKWTPEECRKFELAYEQFGKDWKSVAAAIATRSLVQVRSHAQKCAPDLDRKKALQKWIQNAVQVSHLLQMVSAEYPPKKNLPNGRNKPFAPFEESSYSCKPNSNRQSLG